MASDNNSTPIISPITYLVFLTICLLIYLVYLILPRGLRHYICGTKRRYRRQNARHIIWKQLTLSSNSTNRFSPLPNQVHGLNEPVDHRIDIYPGPDQYYWGASPQYSIRSAPTYTGFDRSTLGRDDTWQSPLSEETNHEIDSVGNTMSYLQVCLTQPPGIKMIAHGTKCKPRHVYITLHFHDATTCQQYVPALEYQNCFTWRAELSKLSSRVDGDALNLGNLRKVSFEDVMGVHRGKVTTALRRIQTANSVDADMCFSLLTKSGTLDLQCCNVDNIPANEVRECFIALLGAALSSRGVMLNGPKVDNDCLLSSPDTSSSNHSLNGNRQTQQAYPVATSTSNQKSSRTHEASVLRTESSSLVSGDANLSVISF